MQIKMKITQYGYKDDPYMDTNTSKALGAWDNKLEAGVSCALTSSAKQALGATKYSWIRISFPAGGSEYRRYDDKAPEHDKRVDLYNPGGFQRTLDDFAEVSVVSAAEAGAFVGSKPVSRDH